MGGRPHTCLPHGPEEVRAQVAVRHRGAVLEVTHLPNQKQTTATKPRARMRQRQRSTTSADNIEMALAALLQFKNLSVRTDLE